ncbi:MAG: phosphatidylserine decarboxylase [Alphaproteobacteria bacterium]|nr:MAG: phosphatidylserine decarboxylase [Alphaproteobacteria bacterium]
MFKLSKDGIRAAKIILLGIVLSLVLGKFLAILGLGLILLFRDEKRIITNEKAVLAPVDGIILSIDEDVNCNLISEINKKWTRITIVNGILDIHTSRMPISGKISDLIYTPGDNAGEALCQKNEKISLFISGAIECIISHNIETIFHNVSIKVQKGQIMQIGQTYANNTIGATIELYLPSDLKILINEGQKVIAGETEITEDISTELFLESSKQ